MGLKNWKNRALTAWKNLELEFDRFILEMNYQSAKRGQLSSISTIYAPGSGPSFITFDPNSEMGREIIAGMKHVLVDFYRAHPTMAKPEHVALLADTPESVRALAMRTIDTTITTAPGLLQLAGEPVIHISPETAALMAIDAEARPGF